MGAGHLPDLFEGMFWLSVAILAVSSLAGTGKGVGVDMVVIAGAGIISVDIVSIFAQLFFIKYK